MRTGSSWSKSKMERKLAAILCADVYGYSRLMGEDEEATLHTLTSHRKLSTAKSNNTAGGSLTRPFQWKHIFKDSTRVAGGPNHRGAGHLRGSSAGLT
jgi:hypothetical protein